MDMKRHLKSALKQLGLDKPRKAQIVVIRWMLNRTQSSLLPRVLANRSSMKPLGLLIPTSLRLLSSLCLR